MEPRTAVSPRDLEMVNRVVLPVEGSSHELYVQSWGVELAALLGARVRAVHVANGEGDPPEDIFDHVVRTCKDHGVEPETVVLHDTDVAAALANEVDPTDLVVIGTLLLGTAFQLGSVTDALIRTAPCPVLVIRIGEPATAA